MLFSVGGITDRGTVAACKTDVSTIQTGVEAYYAKTSGYPHHLVPDLRTGSRQPVPEVGRGVHGVGRRTGPNSDVHTGTGYSVTYYADQWWWPHRW